MPIDLPLLMTGRTRGKRSAVTCALKCGNQCAHAACNTSGNAYFGDIASAALSRRALFGAAGAGAVVVAYASLTDSPALAEARPPADEYAPSGTPLVFAPIAPVDAEADEMSVPGGYTWSPIIRYGDPLFEDSTPFDPENTTAEALATQFGYNNDYTEILEVPGCDGRRAVMFNNHEYDNVALMVPPSTGERQSIEIQMAAHGLSAVDLERTKRGRPWTYVVGGERNRRFTFDTDFELVGPAAGAELLQTAADPSGITVKGTINNCAGRRTPWGTVLSGEENFHGYFAGGAQTEAQRRYGVGDGIRKWETVDPRFSTANVGFVNESNRYGWIVEVDPFDPDSTPRKHTAMGRFKHEGASTIIGEDGRAVAYMGDDQAFEYVYKFVSRDTYVDGDRAHNMALLNNGSLYVARFTGDSELVDAHGTLPEDGEFDGTGEWIQLTDGESSLVDGFTLEEALVNTRLAADAVGATKMDRPEDVEFSPITGKIYASLTKNGDREESGELGVDEVNPRAANRDGHVLEIIEAEGQAGATFTWNLLLVAGDPANEDYEVYFGGYPIDKVSPISCPDNLAFDSVGNLWVSTDGAPDGIGYNDGLFRVTLEGQDRGYTEQFLSVPRDAEVCGPNVYDEDGLVVVAVQHPGEDGEWGAQRSQFPYQEFSELLPRPAVVQTYRTGRGDDTPPRGPGHNNGRGGGTGAPGNGKGRGADNRGPGNNSGRGN
ncbi:PhoX family protein [Brachybacterium fresconis]|uniref:Secreted PhoX family phosphatase n=1 Tax=Brachybacterium fresconis TaxID=173363 RepID=A0ABS4YN27_9MICO|nr:PhoX family phosphatase [Brachybacterium fresconis]MBP2410164.1 secreted PhoX family phosphatase [Brachybacterium fresconis]